MTEQIVLPGLHEVRPEVATLARLMEYQLRKHDDRTGWKGTGRGGDAVDWLRDEVPVLADAVAAIGYTGKEYITPDMVAKVGIKAANVANYAMMAADICGALNLADADGPATFTLQDIEAAFRRWISAGCPGTMKIIIHGDSAWAELMARLIAPAPMESEGQA